MYAVASINTENYQDLADVTDAVKIEVDGLKKYYQDIKDYDGYDKKGRVAQWNQNWPTIWKEQCTKAKLPWTQATATPAAPATGNG